MHIYDLYKFRITLLAHKHINSLTSLRLQKITPASEIHDKNTHSASRGNLFIHRYSLSFGQQSISHKITSAWNVLPLTLRNTKSHFSFKKQLRILIVTNPTYYQTNSKTNSTNNISKHNVCERAKNQKIKSDKTKRGKAGESYKRLVSI
eukprot:Lithocolla_globosa_v1_NODE_479_length_3945_cov_27.737018.p5 type:complete len:149 gc:universal NODE_479_length_3945_cov_27.737018:3366-3812(+)